MLILKWTFEVSMLILFNSSGRFVYDCHTWWSNYHRCCNRGLWSFFSTLCGLSKSLIRCTILLFSWHWCRCITIERIWSLSTWNLLAATAVFLKDCDLEAVIADTMVKLSCVLSDRKRSYHCIIVDCLSGEVVCVLVSPWWSQWFKSDRRHHSHPVVEMDS